MDTKPKATHSGVWTIDSEKNIQVQCFVMDNGERVLSLRGSSRAMGLTGAGSTALVRNLSSKWIASYLSDGLQQWLSDASKNNLPEYTTNTGRVFVPLEASLFIDVCKAYVDALHDGILSGKQEEIALRMYAIMTAFAKVGLVAIIDEVTGYQDDRDRSELQKILGKYVSNELMPWTRRFPDEFYKQMFRLKGWEYRGKPKPLYAGKLTNMYIYNYLPPGVLDELRSKNPKDPITKTRKHRHHQYLTIDTGVQHLDNQLQQTIALMKASDTWVNSIIFLKKQWANLSRYRFLTDDHKCSNQDSKSPAICGAFAFIIYSSTYWLRYTVFVASSMGACSDNALGLLFPYH